jgi:hypothetical protein
VKRGITKYTLDAINGTMAYSRRAAISPTSAESSWSFTSGVGYDLPIGGGGVRFGKKLRLSLLPEVVGFNVGWASSRNLNYAREIQQTQDSVTLRSDVKVRLLTLGTNVSYVPFSSLRMTYALQSQRDMLIHAEGPMGFNKGKQINKTQTAQVNYTPRWLSLLNPNVTLRGQYIERAGPELRLTANDPQSLKNVQNNGSANVTMNLPITRLGSLGRPKRTAEKSSGFSPLAPVQYVFSRMQDVQTTFAFDRGANLSRVVGDAGTPFKSGFSEVASADLRRLSGSNFGSSRRYTTRGSTAFKPSGVFNVDVRGDHTLSFIDQSFGQRRTSRLQWPDLRGRWSDLHRALHLDQSLQSLALSSGYAHSTEEDGPIDAAVERRTKTTQFAPILGWDLVFRSGIRASIASTLTRSSAIDERLYGVTRDKQTTNTDIRFTKNFPASKGIKFPWAKKPVRLPNDLNLNLTCNLTGDKTTVQRSGAPTYVESNTKGLKVASGTTYNFSRTISGGFNLEYRQNDDRKSGIKRRGITVDLNAAFTF